ncbi:MAG TPA: hypothetical protein PKL15_13025, partial [Saprospiraceae bacterium]|nr:hypothetical protein [Saprospiraceae bacterium]
MFLRPTYPARSNTSFPKTQAGAGLCWLALGLAQCHGSRQGVKFCFLFLRPTYPARSNTLFPKKPTSKTRLQPLSSQFCPYLSLMKRLLLAIAILCRLTLSAQAQIDIPGMGKHPVQNGYAKTLRGETLPYFSIYPDYARTALLTR